MKKILLLLALVAILICPSNIFAQDESWVGQEIIAVGDVWLRDSPPKGLYCGKGQQKGLIKKGEKVRVLEYVKITCALLFSYHFLKVERLESGIDRPSRIGYVAAVDDHTDRPLFQAPAQ